MSSKKGYSLIEIAIGIAIITIFLVCTGSLINASFTNYRFVLQRNEALELAIREMEDVLQSDFVEESDIGYNENSMSTRVKIEKIKEGNVVYDDIFKVTVAVDFARTPTSENTETIQLESLKVLK